MNRISHLLHCNGSTDRLTYQRNIAVLGLGKAFIDLVALSVNADVSVELVTLAWFNPFALVNPWLNGGLPVGICISTFCFGCALVWNSVHRARDIGWSHWYGLATAVPFAGPVVTILFALLPGRKRSVWDLV
ncbi:MAG: hypothetical protein ABI599_09490 [Flavobacteriales bacterium]